MYSSLQEYTAHNIPQKFLLHNTNDFIHHRFYLWLIPKCALVEQVPILYPKQFSDGYNDALSDLAQCKRKPARLFSYTERGRSKHRYSRRKVVWDLVSRLIRMGDTAETAIDKIYAVYGGQTSVTNIINGLKRDKKDGTLNPNFRI